MDSLRSPLVSICLPAYNGGDYVAAAIESVLSQTYTNFQLLIADDASSDSTFDIVESYARSDRRIVCWRNQENIGLFPNYNACIERSSGELIKLFAQDDLLEPKMIEAVVTAFAGRPEVSLISTAKRWIDSSGAEIKVLRPFPEDRLISGRDVIIYNMLRLTNWVGEPSAVTFRREFKGDGFDCRLFHSGDIEYWFRVLEGRTFFYLDEILVNFRRHERSATSSNLAGLYFALDWFYLGKKYRSYLESFGEDYRHFCRRAVESAALELEHLISAENLNLERVLSARAPIKADPLALESGFKELSFHALRRLSEVIAELDDLKCRREHEIRRYQNELDGMRNSTSWKLTKPLRLLGQGQAPEPKR